MEGAAVRRLEGEAVERRRVVADQHQLHALQAKHAEGLGPAPVVADQHADAAAQRLPHREAEVAHLEIALLQVLELALGLVLGVAGQVDLAILADDRARIVDQDGRVEAAGFPALPCKLRVAEVKGDAEGGGLLEERPGLRAGHLRLEERIHLGVVEQPARKERGQRELRIDHEVGAARCRLAHQADHALDHIRTRLVAGDGAELGGCDGDDPAHSLSSPDHGAS